MVNFDRKPEFVKVVCFNTITACIALAEGLTVNYFVASSYSLQGETFEMHQVWVCFVFSSLVFHTGLMLFKGDYGSNFREWDTKVESLIKNSDNSYNVDPTNTLDHNENYKDNRP